MGKEKETWTPLKKAELVRLVAEEAETTMANVSGVLQAYERVVRTALLEGFSITIPKVGTLRHTYCPERPEHEWYNPFTKETVIVPRVLAYDRPRMKFSPTFIKEMRDRTSGAPYNG